jgi:ribonucleotide reductase alpha subunit
MRTAKIKDDSGKVIFEQTGILAPDSWGQLAIDIVASKYFYGKVGTPEREGSVYDLVSRVTTTIETWAKWGEYPVPEAFINELNDYCLYQVGSFNSPVWFNVGLYPTYHVSGSPGGWRWDADIEEAVPCTDTYEFPQASACFIQSVEDSMESILSRATAEGMLFKYGSGTGTDNSTLRSTREFLTGGGRPSGPVSFMKIYDAVAGVVKSGGKTRRAAKMETLKVHHPDILEFIQVKAKEDAKARALIAQGYPADFNGEAYSTVCFQNSNLSVRATDTFMQAAIEGRDWVTKEVTTGKDSVTYSASMLLDEIARGTWECGDPGMQFEDTIQHWHTCPNTAPINTSNPCCFVGETLVRTDEGLISIAKLAEMDAAGSRLPRAFAFDFASGMPVLRQIKKAWRAGDTTNLVQVTTDKGLTFKSTPEHHYYLRSGESVEAKDLKRGMRLRKLGRSHAGRHPRTTIETKAGTFYQSRWMWEQVNGPVPDGFEVHHKNENRRDDRSSNLELKASGEHRSMHAAGAANSRYINVSDSLLVETWEAVEALPRQTHKTGPAVTPARWNAYIRKEGLQGRVPIARMDKIRGMSWSEFARWVESSRSLVNDRVEDVHALKLKAPVAVYDIEVEGVHNFEICDRHQSHGIIVSNSEYMFIDDSACNLASINLMKFLNADGTFSFGKFAHCCKTFITAMEILVDNANYPTKKIAENSHKFRPLGLGYANLGALLMASGLPYDSAKGQLLAARITSVMCAAAYLRSAELAAALGAFEGFAENRESMLGVMRQHQRAADRLDDAYGSRLWAQAIELGEKYGYRNSQVTVLAPTGTIAFMMGCDTTGIEPDIALVKYKSLAGGGTLKIVNQTVPMALKTLDYANDQIKVILEHIEQTGTIEGAPGLREMDLPVFDCAFPAKPGGRTIHWQGHVEMMAAVQPFLSGAISKTINLPNGCTVADIRDAYILCWRRGIKAAAIYRDGSKMSQPLNTAKKTEVVAKCDRERLPDERPAITHKFDIQGHEGYATVGLYPDGRPGELFVKMSKEGSTVGGLMDVLGIAISIGLQYGVPLSAFAEKFAHTRFEPSGFTKNKQIPMAKSIVDYLFRWLTLKFDTKAEPTTVKGGGEAEVAAPYYQSDAPSCPVCGAITVRNGTCYRCLSCGESLGCS